jgi:nicotinamide mononucleotide transporter
MNIHYFWAGLAAQWHNTGVLEIIAVMFAVMEVLFAYKNNVLLYPCGIISTLIYTWLFARPEPGLYADASLNAYYLIVSIYGWYLWRKRTQKEESLPVTSCTATERQTTFDIFVLAFILIYIVLRLWTPSTVPLWDALVAGAAWAGMWLLAKRKLENWVVLNISNAIAIPLYFYKKMPLTALLTLFLFVVAVLGYFKWLKIMRKEQEEKAVPE